MSSRTTFTLSLPGGVILAGLWIAVIATDILWLHFDQAPPAWDQGDHLSRALEHWRLIQNLQIFSAEWWHDLWALSPGYRGPLVYLCTTIIFQIFGLGYMQGVAVNILFSGLLIWITYILGKYLFDQNTGFWSAAFCMTIPIFVNTRLDYLLDYGLSFFVTLAFYGVTRWRMERSTRKGLMWSCLSGIFLGLVILNKFTGLLFLITPLLVYFIEIMWKRKWTKIPEIFLFCLSSLVIFGPWLQVNWLTVLTTSSHANAVWIAANLDLNSPLSVWSYYVRVLPIMISWPFLWIFIGGSIFQVYRLYRKRELFSYGHFRTLGWPLAFLAGAYIIFSLLQNKDPRHIMPCLPVLILLLTRVGIIIGRNGKHQLARLGFIMMTALFISSAFALPGLPKFSHSRAPSHGENWPHRELASLVRETEPYVKSVIGVLPNTSQINPMNIDFYGKMENFQVFGREIGFNERYAVLDAQSLDWFLVKSGDQGPKNGWEEDKPKVQENVVDNTEFTIFRSWKLPDTTDLFLYHREKPIVSALALGNTKSTLQASDQQISDQPSELFNGMLRIEVFTPSAEVVVGQVHPFEYRISGSLKDIESGILLLTWEKRNSDSNDLRDNIFEENLSETSSGTSILTHDHGVALGLLTSNSQIIESVNNESLEEQYIQVAERIGLPVPVNSDIGEYVLKAQLLNRDTGEVSDFNSVSSPDLRVIGNEVTSSPRVDQEFQPDLVSYIRQIALKLATGDLESVFDVVTRINQYDPYQDYTKQAEVAFNFRLRNDPSNLEYLYPLALAQVLQQKGAAAADTLEKITDITPDNPYSWAYLAFVRLYQWQPGLAQKALNQLEAMDADLPEVVYLKAVASMQSLNLVRLWHILKEADVL